MRPARAMPAPAWWSSCARRRCPVSSASARAARTRTTARPRRPSRSSWTCCWAPCRLKRSISTAASTRHGAAKCALDIALHDLVGKALGLPIHRLLGLSPEIPPTDFTLGLDEPAVVAERARRSARFPALKIKMGGPHDLATLEAVRAVYEGPIRVDANPVSYTHLRA